MIVYKLENYKINKQFKDQLNEIKIKPYVNLFGETVSNYAVLTEHGRDVAVKYEPNFNQYTLEIKTDNEKDLLALIKKLK